MAFEHDEIRRWVAQITDEELNEVFSPMKSLALSDDDVLEEATRADVIETLMSGFVNHLCEAGFDPRTLPTQLLEGARLVIETAYDRGRDRG